MTGAADQSPNAPDDAGAILSGWKRRRSLLREAAALAASLVMRNETQARQQDTKKSVCVPVVNTETQLGHSLSHVAAAEEWPFSLITDAAESGELDQRESSQLGSGANGDTTGRGRELSKADQLEQRQTTGRVRWTGNLGPSLLLTAVERQADQRGLREAGEAAGRHCRRVLRMTAEQRARNDLPEPLAIGPDRPEERRRAIRSFAAMAAASTALVTGGKSAQPANGHGWNGLPATGRRAIRDAGALLADQYGSLSFVTATLPEATADVATRSQVAEFQTRLLFLVRRRLVALGLPPVVLLVAEMHPGRRARDGALVPHWHGIIQVSSQPYQRWRFRKEDWNRCVLQAHAIAFGFPRGHTQRLAMLPQRTGAARYLSKYLSKGSSDVRRHEGQQTGRMVPRQWWAWTGTIRERVMAARVRPPAPFLRWCLRWRRELEDLGECQTGLIQLPDGGPIIGAWFGWRNEAALDRAIAAWIEAELLQADRCHSPPADGAETDQDGVIVELAALPIS